MKVNPNEEQLEKKLKDLDAKIDEVHQKKRQYFDNLIKQNKANKEENANKMQPTR